MDEPSAGGSLLFLGAVLAVYLIPTIVAFIRSTANRLSVAVVNVFLGWTFIGWVVALAMAVGGAGPRKTTREYLLGKPRGGDVPPPPQ